MIFDEILAFIGYKIYIFIALYLKKYVKFFVKKFSVLYISI